MVYKEKSKNIILSTYTIKMQYKEFIAISNYHTIAPVLLLEDDGIIELLESKATKEELDEYIQANY